MINRRLFSLLRADRHTAMLFALTVGLSAGVGLLIVLQGLTLSRSIARIFPDGESLTDIAGLLIAFVVTVLLRSLLSAGSALSAAQLSIRTRADLRRRLIQHITALGPAYTSGERSGELTLTATEGVDALDPYLREYLPALFTAILVPLIILIFVFPLDTLTFIILMVTAPLIPIFMALIGAAAGVLARRQFNEMRFLGAHFLDVLRGLVTLKVFNRSRYQIQTIAAITDQFREATLRVLRIAFLSAFMLEMLATLSVAMVAVEIGLRVLYGTLSYEQALFLLIIAPEFYQPLRTLGSRFHASTSGRAASDRVFQVLDTPIPGTQGTLPAPKRMDIQFNGISFSYQGGKRPAIQDAQFEIRHGQRIALVGHSGSGKSTIAALLLKFLQPSTGQIKVDGVDLADIDSDSWRSRIGWVSQRPYLFHMSIADNIRLGWPEATFEDVIRAAQAADAHDFISALPDGYATLCGEHGLRFSGGQGQRIAIARAFLRDPDLLILDEATSQLDSRSEQAIQDSLRRLMQGRTSVIIAHRIDTIADADLIVVLGDGRILEQGTHTALMAQGGTYAQLVEANRRERMAIQGDPIPVGSCDLSVKPKMRPQDGPNKSRQLRAWIRPFLPEMALAILLGILTIGSSIGLMATSAWLISKAALRPSIADLGISVVAVRFFGIARGGCRYLERLVAHRATFRFLARLRVEFYRALEPLAPARLMGYRSGDLLARVIGDIETLQNIFLRVIAPVGTTIGTIALTGLLFAAIDPFVASVSQISLLLAAITIPMLAWWSARGAGQRLIAVRAALSTAIVEGIQGLPDSLAYGRKIDTEAEIRALQGSDQQLAGREAFQTGLALLLVNAAALCVLIAAIPRVDGIFLALLTLTQIAAFEPIPPLAMTALHAESTRIASRRLMAILGTPSVSEIGSLPAPAGSDIQYERVTFRYDAELRPMLSDFSLTIPQGMKLAVIGASGSGKSTLVNLLLRFWEIESGSIALDGVDIRQIGIEALRGRFGVMTQRTHLFNTTIRENIRLARPEATDEELIVASQRARLHEFVQNLPDGYDTVVGEDGVALSAGERQRLALARVLLCDAPILILDEPTANLDPVNERAILETILEITTGRTLILLTHRPTLLERMDRVIRLEYRDPIP